MASDVNATRGREPRDAREYRRQRRVKDLGNADATYEEAIADINKRIESINGKNANGIPRIGGPSYIQTRSFTNRLSQADLIKMERDVRAEEQRVGIKTPAKEQKAETKTETKTEEKKTPVDAIPAPAPVPESVKTTTEPINNVTPDATVPAPVVPATPAAPVPVVPTAPVPAGSPQPVVQPAAVPAAPVPVVPTAPVPAGSPQPVVQPAAVPAAPVPAGSTAPAAPPAPTTAPVAPTTAALTPDELSTLAKDRGYESIEEYNAAIAAGTAMAPNPEGPISNVNGEWVKPLSAPAAPAPLDAIPNPMSPMAWTTNQRNEKNPNTASAPLKGLSRDGSGLYVDSEQQSSIVPGRSDGGPNRIYTTLNANQGLAANYGADWTTLDDKKYPEATDANAKAMGLPDALAVQRRLVLGGKVDKPEPTGLKTGEQITDVRIDREIKGQGVIQDGNGKTHFDSGYVPGQVVGTVRKGNDFEKAGDEAVAKRRNEMLKDPKYGYKPGSGFATPAQEASYNDEIAKVSTQIRATENDKAIAGGAGVGVDPLAMSKVPTNKGFKVQTERNGETSEATVKGGGFQGERNKTAQSPDVRGTYTNGEIEIKDRYSEVRDKASKLVNADTIPSVADQREVLREEVNHSVQDADGKFVKAEKAAVTPEMRRQFLADNPGYAETASKMDPKKAEDWVNDEVTARWGGAGTVQTINANNQDRLIGVTPTAGNMNAQGIAQTPRGLDGLPMPGSVPAPGIAKTADGFAAIIPEYQSPLAPPPTSLPAPDPYAGLPAPGVDGSALAKVRASLQQTPTVPPANADTTAVPQPTAPVPAGSTAPAATSQTDVPNPSLSNSGGGTGGTVPTVAPQFQPNPSSLPVMNSLQPEPVTTVGNTGSAPTNLGNPVKLTPGGVTATPTATPQPLAIQTTNPTNVAGLDSTKAPEVPGAKTGEGAMQSAAQPDQPEPPKGISNAGVDQFILEQPEIRPVVGKPSDQRLSMNTALPAGKTFGDLSTPVKIEGVNADNPAAVPDPSVILPGEGEIGKGLAGFAKSTVKTIEGAAQAAEPSRQAGHAALDSAAEGVGNFFSGAGKFVGDQWTGFQDQSKKNAAEEERKRKAALLGQ